MATYSSKGLLGDVRLCAISVGDTRAASGRLGLAVATCALGRGYARRATALVVTDFDDGGVDAAVLQKEA
jgi:hypothetical protein